MRKNYSVIKKQLDIPSDCPGINWRGNNKDGELDKEIVPFLVELNKLGYCHTTGSCAGHSLSEINKQGKGWMIDEPFRISVNIHVKSESIDKFSELVYKLWNVSGNSLWCELGFLDDYNDQTEKGFIPFHIIVYGRNKKRRDNLLKKFVEKFNEQ